MEQTGRAPVYTVCSRRKEASMMEKNPPRKTVRVPMTPEKKAEFFHGLELYMSEYKRKLLRRHGVPAPVSRAS